jgi:hypothetical protein
MVEKGSSPNLLEEVMKHMEEKVSWLKIREKEHTELPKVFVDGYTGVKVSLVRNFVNCETKGENGYIYEGCFKIRDGGLVLTEGIFYIPIFKINPVGSFTTLAVKYDEVEEAVEKGLNAVRKRVGAVVDEKRWLIKVRGTRMKVYINALKGKEIKYDLIGRQGKLHIINVPPVNVRPVSYSITSDIELYNHRVEFDNEVMRFRVYNINGLAELVYTLRGVTAKITSPDHRELSLRLYPGELYLFTHPAV